MAPLVHGGDSRARSWPAPDFDLYATDDGGRVGIKFVDGSDALDEAGQAKGAWLELVVGDVGRCAERLLELGARPVDYVDKSHAYFQIPGGPVFRLAAD